MYVLSLQPSLKERMPQVIVMSNVALVRGVWCEHPILLTKSARQCLLFVVPSLLLLQPRRRAKRLECRLRLLRTMGVRTTLVFLCAYALWHVVVLEARFETSFDIAHVHVMAKICQFSYFDPFAFFVGMHVSRLYHEAPSRTSRKRVFPKNG